MPTEEPLSGVDNQIKVEFMTVRTIQAITDLLAEHNRVIGFLTDRIAQGDSNGKGNVVTSRPGPIEQAGGAAHAPGVAFVGSQYKDSTNGFGAEPKNMNNSKGAMQYGSQKLGVGRTGRKVVSKHVKKEGEPGAPKRKLEFCEEKDSDFGELRNIQQRGLESPFTFYTHRLADDVRRYAHGKMYEASLCMDIYFWPPPGMQFFSHELAVAAYVFAEDLEQSELLVQNDHCVGNREALWILRPGEEVMDDVINLVVATLTAGKDQHRWWLLTTFSVFEPLVSQQAEDLMDCGVWVSQWMILSHLWASYELEEVNDSTQMTLAIDLVMGSHNPIVEEVAEKARRY
ncbi:hypothetical protein AHAS_Ahas16G0224100 [Arachis hypogaea]